MVSRLAPGVNVSRRGSDGLTLASTLTINACVAFALSTVSRNPTSPASFASRAERLGLRAASLDASLDGDTLEALVPALLAAGLQVVALEAPCPRPPGQRAPYLATDDREERLAATRAFEATLATAGRVGAARVVVQLGVLAVKHDWSETVRAFARGTLDDEARERLVAMRRRLGAHALDLARFALDPLLARSADAGVTIGLINRARWFEIPSAGEVAALIGEFRGAPLAPFYDTAAAHIRAGLGLGTGRPAVEVERACGAFLSDAAGIRGGLPWGTGEIDPAVLTKLPPESPRILRSSLATDDEIRAALV